MNSDLISIDSSTSKRYKYEEKRLPWSFCFQRKFRTNKLSTNDLIAHDKKTAENFDDLTRGRHKWKFSRYQVPIGTQIFFSGRYPVPIGTQILKISMGTGVLLAPTPGFNLNFRLILVEGELTLNLIIFLFRRIQAPFSFISSSKTIPSKNLWFSQQK